MRQEHWWDSRGRGSTIAVAPLMVCTRARDPASSVPDVARRPGVTR